MPRVLAELWTAREKKLLVFAKSLAGSQTITFCHPLPHPEKLLRTPKEYISESMKMKNVSCC